MVTPSERPNFGTNLKNRGALNDRYNKNIYNDR